MKIAARAMTARLLGACGKSPLPMARGDRNTFWKGQTLPNAGSRRKGTLGHDCVESGCFDRCHGPASNWLRQCFSRRTLVIKSWIIGSNLLEGVQAGINVARIRHK